METLEEFIKNKSNFLTLKSGEIFKGIYKGYKIVERERFGRVEKVVCYSFQELSGDKIWQLNSTSVSLARQMKDAKEGDVVAIKRIGEGRNTKYEVLIEKKPEQTQMDVPASENEITPEEIL